MHKMVSMYYTSLNNFLKSTIIFLTYYNILIIMMHFFQIKVLYTLLNSRARFYWVSECLCLMPAIAVGAVGTITFFFSNKVFLKIKTLKKKKKKKKKT